MILRKISNPSKTNELRKSLYIHDSDLHVSTTENNFIVANLFTCLLSWLKNIHILQIEWGKPKILNLKNEILYSVLPQFAKVKCIAKSLLCKQK